MQEFVALTRGFETKSEKLRAEFDKHVQELKVSLEKDLTKEHLENFIINVGKLLEKYEHEAKDLKVHYEMFMEKVKSEKNDLILLQRILHTLTQHV